MVTKCEIVYGEQRSFGPADQIEARFQEAQAQVDQLTPALPARAFRGQRVPQDPNDEPASASLRRLRRSVK